MLTPAAKRHVETYLQAAFAVSERCVCEVLGVDRTAGRYTGRRLYDASARERMSALASERRRFGYRSLHWLLSREGMHMNHKEVPAAVSRGTVASAASEIVFSWRKASVLQEFETSPRQVHLVHEGPLILPLKLRAVLDFVAPRLEAHLAALHD